MPWYESYPHWAFCYWFQHSVLMHFILSNSGLKWQSKRSKGWIRRVYRLAIGLFYNIQPRKQIGHLKQNPKPANICKFTVTVGLIGYHFYFKLLFILYLHIPVSVNDILLGCSKIADINDEIIFTNSAPYVYCYG